LTEKIIIAGSGGQGIIFAGELLAEAGMRNGLNVSVLPSYGPEMRGGTAHSTVTLSTSEIYSPIQDTINILISLNLPSLERFFEMVEDNGLIIHNSSLGVSKKDFGKFKYFGLPLSEKASELGDIRVTNIIALGALNKILNLVDEKFLRESLILKLSGKKQNLIDLNLNAITAGKDLVSD